MIILQVMEKQLDKVKGRMDLQLKIIAELMQLQHQKSQNRLLQRMTVRRKWYGYLLQEVNIIVFLTVEI